MTEPLKAYGEHRRGVTAADVERAADALFRAGERPTIEKVRAKLGTGSPNTINPLLDVWWKTASARLDAGPTALHRLPESVAHIAEALWMRALTKDGAARTLKSGRPSAWSPTRNRPGTSARMCCRWANASSTRVCAIESALCTP